MRGDRLGHATALGIEVADYFSRKREYIVTTLEEHADNLAWMWGMLSNERSNETDLIAFLNRQFDYYAAELFSDVDDVAMAAPSVEEYWLAYSLRGDNLNIYLDEYEGNCAASTTEYDVLNDKKSNHARAIKNVRKLFIAYHFDSKLKQAGQRPLVIHVEKEYMDSVEQAQQVVWKKIHDAGISIETNPTSNRRISSIERYIELPLLKFNRKNLNSGSFMQKVFPGPNLLATINSDDSGVFQTDLAMEYALIVEALRRDGCEESDIYDYIEVLRENSLIQSLIRRSTHNGVTDGDNG